MKGNIFDNPSIEKWRNGQRGPFNGFDHRLWI